MDDISRSALTRGGAAQRARAFEHVAFQRKNQPSCLARLLIDMWKWGQLPAASVQRLAAAAQKDLESQSVAMTEITRLAELGGHGSSPANVARDLLRKLPKPIFQVHSFQLWFHFHFGFQIHYLLLLHFFLEASPEMLPLRLGPAKGSVGRVCPTRVSVLLPEDAWRSIWQHGKVSEFLLKDANSLPEFWRQVQHHPSLQQHPVRNIVGYEGRAVPVLLHGDGAAVTQLIGANTKSCLFISFRSLVAGRPHPHILLAAVWCHACNKGRMMNTARRLYQIIADSFWKLLQQEGRGTQGYFCVPVFTTGDLEFFNEFHFLPRWNARKPCGLCNIDAESVRGHHHVSALGPDNWRDHRGHDCPLFHRVMSRQSVAPDWMHSKHLGVDLRLLGSVIWLLIYKLSTDLHIVEDRMQRLLCELKEHFIFHFL